MRWSDELTLTFEQSTPDHADATDSDGFTLPRVGKETTVYANKKSVGFSEFFKAKQAGYTEQLKFDIFTVEYEGQTLAEYEGKRYRILRTYIDPKTAGEFTELTLSDLSERGGDADGL